MRFTIPFRYSALYVLKGKRTPVDALQIGEVTVDIPEPVAPRLAFSAGHDIVTEHDCIVFGQTPAGPARVWDVDGTYYAERVAVSDFVELATTSRDEDQNPFHAFGHGRSALPFFYSKEETEKQRRSLADIREKFGEVRSWDDPGGVTEARDISLRASEAVVIDGMVCFTVTEPVLTVTSTAEEVCIAVVEMTPGGASDFSLQTEIGAHLMTMRFRLDDKAGALRYAAAIARLEQLPVRDGASVKSVDTAPRFPSEAENVMSLCDAVVDRLKGSVPGMEEDLALAWCDLRDARLRANGSLSPDMVVALEQIVQIVTRRGPENNLAGSDNERFQWRMMAAEHTYFYQDASDPVIWLTAAASLGRMTLDDWYDRPQIGSEWVDHALPGNGVNGAGLRTRQILDNRQLDLLGKKLSIDLEPYRSEAVNGTCAIIEVESEGQPHVAVVGVNGTDLAVLQVKGAYGREAGESARAVLDHAMSIASDKLEEEYSMGDLAF